MPQPTFIAIGPQKAGTTWLDAVMRQHGDICLPADRKEVFFFDRYYDRGLDWYEGLFSHCAACNAIGEVTPTYFAKPHTLRRIAAHYPDIRLVIILRNPVERLITHYGMFIENGSRARDIYEALDMHEALYRASNYAAHLPVLFDLFDPEQIHIMIYEELFAHDRSRQRHLYELARFLGVNADEMVSRDIAEKIRETRGPPKSRLLYGIATYIRKLLLRYDMEWIVKCLNRLGLRRAHFLQKSNTPPHKKVDEVTRRELYSKLAEDIRVTELYTGRTIEQWHPD
jgi:hypothetical protein